ncbi:hypothetical protein [Arthrobacter sp. NPDC093139]
MAKATRPDEPFDPVFLDSKIMNPALADEFEPMGSGEEAPA